MNWIKCEDGSWINADHVTRLFVVIDGLKNSWQVRASIGGPQNPFVIKSSLVSQELANQWLDALVDKL